VAVIAPRQDLDLLRVSVIDLDAVGSTFVIVTDDVDAMAAVSPAVKELGFPRGDIDRRLADRLDLRIEQSSHVHGSLE
jgi:hypothetical protein